MLSGMRPNSNQEEPLNSASEIIYDKAHVSNILDASINIGLTALLVISCLLILKPFVPLLVWGMIIAIASYPRFEKLKNLLGGRGGWLLLSGPCCYCSF